VPPPDAVTVSFSNEEMAFAWRSHFVAASIVPISKAAREAAEAKAWTLFELPKAVASGIPKALIAMFERTAV
jgi:hypothetical protein